MYVLSSRILIRVHRTEVKLVRVFQTLLGSGQGRL